MADGLTFLCSPFRGDVDAHVQYACRAMRHAIMMGCTPIAPHLLFTRMLDDDVPSERAAGLALGSAILAECRSVLVYDDYGISAGMAQEIASAYSIGLPVQFYTIGRNP